EGEAQKAGAGRRDDRREGGRGAPAESRGIRGEAAGDAPAPDVTLGEAGAPIRGRSPQRADALDFSARQEQAELARSGAQNYVKADPSFAGAGLAESLLRSEVLDTARVSSDAGRVEQGPLRAR